MKPGDYINTSYSIEEQRTAQLINIKSGIVPVTNKLSQIENDICDTVDSIQKLKKQIRRNVWVYSKR